MVYQITKNEHNTIQVDPNDPANVDLMQRVAEAGKRFTSTGSGGESRPDVTSSSSSAAGALADLGVRPGGHFRLGAVTFIVRFCIQVG